MQNKFYIKYMSAEGNWVIYPDVSFNTEDEATQYVIKKQLYRLTFKIVQLNIANTFAKS